MVCDLKLNGHKGKCLIIRDNYQNIVDLNSKESPISEVLDSVLNISDIRSVNIEVSGGKGASLAALNQLSNKSETTFVVPKGLIVTTNAYKYLIDGSDDLENEIDKLENIAW